MKGRKYINKTRCVALQLNLYYLPALCVTYDLRDSGWLTSSSNIINGSSKICLGWEIGLI